MEIEPRVLSIVVPTRNSSRTLEQCLRHVSAQRYPHVELIVVDNGSTDGTLAIAGRFADLVETYGPERSAQRNRGAELASGDVILFIDSDQLVEPAVAEEVVEAFLANASLGAVVVPELAVGDGFLAACRSLEKRLYLGDARVEAARAFRRCAFAHAHGYDESLWGAEDYDLPDRVVRAGWQLGRVDSAVWHDEGKVRLAATFRKKRYYGASLPHYFALTDGAHFRLTRPSLLRHPGALVRQPLHAIGLVLLKSIDAIGLTFGALQAWRSAAR